MQLDGKTERQRKRFKNSDRERQRERERETHKKQRFIWWYLVLKHVHGNDVDEQTNKQRQTERKAYVMASWTLVKILMSRQRYRQRER